MTLSADEVEVSLFSAWTRDVPIGILHFMLTLGHLYVNHSLQLMRVAELRLLVYKSIVRDLMAPGGLTLGVM